MKAIIRVQLFIAIFFLAVLSLLYSVLIFPSSMIAKIYEIIEWNAVSLILLFSISLLFSLMVSESVLGVYLKILRKRQKPLKLGEILVLGGYISKIQLDNALNEQRHRIGEILIDAGRITIYQLQHALDLQENKKRRLGKILRRMRYATKEDIDWALKQAGRKMGQILLEKRLLSFSQLQDALYIQQEYQPI